MGDWQFENAHYVTYGDFHYIPRCRECGAFVSKPESISFNFDGLPHPDPHTICWRCGPTKMIEVGYY